MTPVAGTEFEKQKSSQFRKTPSKFEKFLPIFWRGGVKTVGLIALVRTYVWRRFSKKFENFDHINFFGARSTQGNLLHCDENKTRNKAFADQNKEKPTFR